ncbi:hypothetical protein B0H34DRAFT_808043 [Crassisporium funariophilum]|nr:hypothetical protein B0H34DRAFT_808043 [Crassisporium funariophilum]
MYEVIVWRIPKISHLTYGVQLKGPLGLETFTVCLKGCVSKFPTPEPPVRKRLAYGPHHRANSPPRYYDITFHVKHYQYGSAAIHDIVQRHARGLATKRGPQTTTTRPSWASPTTSEVAKMREESRRGGIEVTKRHVLRDCFSRRCLRLSRTSGIVPFSDDVNSIDHLQRKFNFKGMMQKPENAHAAKRCTPLPMSALQGTYPDLWGHAVVLSNPTLYVLWGLIHLSTDESRTFRSSPPRWDQATASRSRVQSTTEDGQHRISE